MIAYMSYDSLSGDILSIAWNQPADSFIEIDKSIAEDFMTGKEKMHEYFVPINQKILKKKEFQQRIPKSFWSLKILDGSDSNMKIQSSFDCVRITLDAASYKNLMLFATIKNDPSWLISSWDLSDFKEIEGIITIKIVEAEKYSYYIGKIR